MSHLSSWKIKLSVYSECQFLAVYLLLQIYCLLTLLVKSYIGNVHLYDSKNKLQQFPYRSKKEIQMDSIEQ